MPRPSIVQNQLALLQVPTNPTTGVDSSDSTPRTPSPTPTIPSPVEAYESAPVQPLRLSDSVGNLEETEGENVTEEQRHYPNVDEEDNVRYHWSKATTLLLLGVLVDAKLGGQQGEYGFKKAVWNSAIARIYQANPNERPPTITKCRSRVETLKCSWKLWDAHLNQTENRSGWWDADGLPQADVHVMDVYFSQYPKYKRFRHEKLPFCEQLKLLLENRLATGSHAATQSELEMDSSEGNNEDEDMDLDLGDDSNCDEEGPQSSVPSIRSSGSCRGRKRPASALSDIFGLAKRRSTANEVLARRLEKSDERMSADFRFLVDAVVQKPLTQNCSPLALATRLLVREFRDMSAEAKIIVLHSFRQDSTLAEVFINLEEDKEAMRHWIQDIRTKSSSSIVRIINNQ